jgi:anti-sigma B factor antagonist
MILYQDGETLSITGVRELGLANRDSFCNEVRAALPNGITNIVIDLSETNHMDCSGLGALISLSKAARSSNRGISIRLVNPAPPVRYILNLTNMNGLFPIEHFAVMDPPSPVLAAPTRDCHAI